MSGLKYFWGTLYYRLNSILFYLTGRTFKNPFPYEARIQHWIYWLLFRKKAVWPSWIQVEQRKINRERIDNGEMAVTYVNHATVLIQINGLNILVDPIWSNRTGPLPWIGLHRVRPPGINFNDLPPIDYVLVSHNHFDHMDIPTLWDIFRDHTPQLYTGWGNRAFLEARAISNVIEMKWWQTVTLGHNVKLTFVPAQHTSGRGPLDLMKSLWGGFVIEGGQGKIYYAGDTAYAGHFKEIRKRFNDDITLAILPIGAYKPRWFIRPDHIDPIEAVDAHIDLGAKTTMAVHFGTFQLSDEAIDEPIEDLQNEIKVRKIPEEQFWIPQFGETKYLFKNASKIFENDTEFSNIQDEVKPRKENQSSEAYIH